jgi:threonylcarbamoyladenosine tRNA methylthiotransferase MtaB
MSKRVYLDSVGCRLNQSEITQMTRQFQSLGYAVVNDPAEADLFVVNTCAVTSDAAKDSRKLVRRLHGQSQSAEIAVTGCYAHLAADRVGALPGVRYVVNNFEKDKLVSLVTGEPIEAEPLERDYTPGTARLTRAFVKVQDGCDNKCTFCITTVARGAGRSRPLEEVIHEVRLMVSGGYQEVVLTGVHLGSYGHDWGNKNGLRDLVRALLAETDIPRLRLSSLEPWDLSEDFFRLWDSPRLCRHLHLPLQSGSDRTLKRMLRHTNQRAFRELVGAARKQIPDLALSTDIIVGFPGEDEDEFSESCAFVAEMDFMKIHVFPYSVREGTAAARMKGRVDPAIIKERLRVVQQLSDEGGRRFRERYLGGTFLVLWEQVRGASEEGFWHAGLTDHYIRVEMKHPRIFTNAITPTRLVGLSLDGMVGELIGASVL